MGVKFFRTMASHLACHHVIVPTSSKGFRLLSIVWFVASTFLGCWALITHAFITCFQRSDHLIILDVVAYVETNTFLFQLVMWDTQTLLPQVVHFQVPPLKIKLWYTHIFTYRLLNKPFTWAKIYHTYSKCSFECYMNMSLILCRSNHRHLVINSSYHICILFVFNSFLYNVTNSP